MSSIEAFERTYEAMNEGQTLLVMGGTWPSVGETTELKVGLRYFIPVRSLLHSLKEYPLQDNPLWTPESEDPVTVEFTRDKERLAHEPASELAVAYGKRFGRIGETVVDIWVLGEFSDSTFHIGKCQ